MQEPEQGWGMVTTVMVATPDAERRGFSLRSRRIARSSSGAMAQLFQSGPVSSFAAR